jgi:hypothetical protein
MKVKSLAKAGKRPQKEARRATLSSLIELQKRYEHATAALPLYFPHVDDWAAEHEPDLWRQLRLEDDELLRLRQIGVSESRFQAKLEEFLTLCARAEQSYYDAQPQELHLPPLPEGKRVAIYFALADGSLQSVQEVDE